MRAIADRIARDAFDLQKRGVGVIAVIPNDYVRDPEDAPEQVNRFAKEHGFSFPYVVPPEAHRPQNQLDPSWARDLAVV